MYYDLPLFGVNVKIWMHLGFIEFENLYRITPLLVIVVLTIFGQVSFVLISQELNRKIMNLFTTAIVVNSFLRIVIVMKNQQKFINFMKVTERWYKEAELFDFVIPESVQERLRVRAAAISKFSLILGTLGAYITCLKPFFLKYRTHPFEVHFFAFDALQSPLYEIIFAVQCFVVVPFLACSYIPFTNLFISWLLLGINVCKVLHKKFQELPAATDKDQSRSLKVLIRNHKRIISFAKTLEDLFSFVCFVELLLFTMMLCLLLLCTLVEEKIVFQIVYLSYIFTVSNLIFMSYWHANEFSSEGLRIADAVYSMDWTSSSVEVRKCVLILLMRSQSSWQISAGGIYPMTLESFQALLNTGYTYFNLMRGFMRK